MYFECYVYRDHIMYLVSSLLNFIKFTSLCQSLTMVFYQFIITAIFLLSITAVKTDSVPYQNIQLAFSITPKLMYTSESNPVFNGYSYTTQDFNGGESNVIFTTGSDSLNRLKNEMDLMKISERSLQRDKNQKHEVSLEQQSKPEKSEESSKKQDLDSNIKDLTGEKELIKNSEIDNNLIEHQANLEQVSLTDVSYPMFTHDLLNLHLPVLPRYQISPNLMQNQYYSHNPYVRLGLPLHNFGFYDSVPLFYQAETIIHDNSKSESTAVENIETSESHIIKSSLQTNTTDSKSNSENSSIISRLNQESTTDGIKKSTTQSIISTNKLESTTSSEKLKEEIMTSETAVTTETSVEQTTK